MEDLLTLFPERLQKSAVHVLHEIRIQAGCQEHFWTVFVVGQSKIAQRFPSLEEAIAHISSPSTDCP